MCPTIGSVLVERGYLDNIAMHGFGLCRLCKIRLLLINRLAISFFSRGPYQPLRPSLSASALYPSCKPSPLQPRVSAYVSVAYGISSVLRCTVICSRRKSRSSSQLAKFCFAPESLDSRRVSASSIGYASITFAPSHRYTSSVGETYAFA